MTDDELRGLTIQLIRTRVMGITTEWIREAGSVMAETDLTRDDTDRAYLYAVGASVFAVLPDKATIDAELSRLAALVAGGAS
jgi:hypothetical protein